ncbi:ADP-ribose pyrophosphatase, mitochondrial isoform X2 [Lynx canadensis]|uniref:ADP-ribose pyrophosphatase, mitochondrial isoform X2 n=1 Tax=Lynx canadensis TaxID=61383 RepID=UPI0011AFE636|nr:ADP-ribose pyrophosphatase, mitochondrial isoform X2 [Lynx canadensis]XP_046947046.1 ADP-ribose pyrophosphatase, mitochondrial isoform X2 [Lynx rufus]
MAERILGKTLATVSLSVALASVTVKSSGCCSIPACRSSFLSCGFHLNSNIMSSSNGAKENSHNKARTSPYPGSKVQRSQVPNEKVGWFVEWQDYNPVEYTAVSVLAGPRWADPQIRNPAGRTGLIGRGLLGRWGPNHAADPIITRWKRDRSGNKITHPVSGKNILQFVAIKRKDCGEWAIPGGMVDPGEKISATLKREFGEEALNSLQKSSAEKRELEEQLHKLFSQEHLVIYKGYVDDPRNTDNAWMETEAVNYHDETGEIMDNLTLEAGDDAGKVKWVDISDQLQLYASHSQFIKLVAEKRDAHWSENSDAECRGL